MTKNGPQLDDLTARRDALRRRLRVKADKVLAVVEALPAPQSLNEAAQAAQAVMAADNMVTQVFSEAQTSEPNIEKAKLH